MRGLSALAACSMMALAGRDFMELELQPKLGLPRFTRYATGYSRPHSHSIAKLNRHTGKPHEHKREIARNQRKANLRVLRDWGMA